MKVGDTPRHKGAVRRAETKQGRLRQLAAANKRNSKRRSMLRHAKNPPRVMRSMRDVQQRSRIQTQTLFGSIGRALRKG